MGGTGSVMGRNGERNGTETEMDAERDRDKAVAETGKRREMEV